LVEERGIKAVNMGTLSLDITFELGRSLFFNTNELNISKVLVNKDWWVTRLLLIKGLDL
jgi:hypothetical protein